MGRAMPKIQENDRKAPKNHENIPRMLPKEPHAGLPDMRNSVAWRFPQPLKRSGFGAITCMICTLLVQQVGGAVSTCR